MLPGARRSTPKRTRRTSGTRGERTHALRAPAQPPAIERAPAQSRGAHTRSARDCSRRRRCGGFARARAGHAAAVSCRASSGHRGCFERPTQSRAGVLEAQTTRCRARDVGATAKRSVAHTAATLSGPPLSTAPAVEDHGASSRRHGRQPQLRTGFPRPRAAQGRPSVRHGVSRDRRCRQLHKFSRPAHLHTCSRVGGSVR